MIVITLIAVCIVLSAFSIFLFLRLRQWQFTAAKWQERCEHQDSSEDKLQWATNGQLFDELKNRPNNHFIMLIPRTVGEDTLGVETHVCNMGGPKEVLRFLKAAQAGVRQVGEDGYDNDNNDISPLWDV